MAGLARRRQGPGALLPIAESQRARAEAGAPRAGSAIASGERTASTRGGLSLTAFDARAPVPVTSRNLRGPTCHRQPQSARLVGNALRTPAAGDAPATAERASRAERHGAQGFRKNPARATRKPAPGRRERDGRDRPAPPGPLGHGGAYYKLTTFSPTRGPLERAARFELAEPATGILEGSASLSEADEARRSRAVAARGERWAAGIGRRPASDLEAGAS